MEVNLASWYAFFTTLYCYSIMNSFKRGVLIFFIPLQSMAHTRRIYIKSLTRLIIKLLLF